MRKILKLFFNRYYTNGKRTIDILLYCWRKYIDWVYHISLDYLLSILLCLSLDGVCLIGYLYLYFYFCSLIWL